MEIAPRPPQRAQEINNGKKIVIIIAIYLILTMSAKFTQNTSTMSKQAIQNMISSPGPFFLKDLFDFFEGEQWYEGRWSNPENKLEQLSDGVGKFELKVTQNNDPDEECKIQILMYNGDYVDKGTVEFSFFVLNSEWNSTKKYNNQIKIKKNSNSETMALYSYSEIFKPIENTQENLTSTVFLFKIIQQSKVEVSMTFQWRETEFELNLIGQQHKIMKIMIFAGMMFLVSYLPFSAIMNILRGIFEERDNVRNYSLGTLTLCTMWDAVLCLVAFIFAFKDQQSLILFIMPAFLLCLLFTNLQLRLMMMIFHSRYEGSNRQIICKFNLLSYGSLLLIYPILIILNFNWVFFIGMSCILFPQIYANGRSGHRPDFSSPYYTKFLLVRFAIIFYLRCFPFNVFAFKPDYLLSVSCLCLIAFQFALLYIQKLYGSKKVIPKFLLQPIYDYNCNQPQIQVNVEESSAPEVKQCVICLNSLSHEPAQLNQGGIELPGHRLMKTPCNHMYHSLCLIMWMKIKMECPQCRNKLPPFQ